MKQGEEEDGVVQTDSSGNGTLIRRASYPQGVEKDEEAAATSMATQFGRKLACELIFSHFGESVQVSILCHGVFSGFCFLLQLWSSFSLCSLHAFRVCSESLASRLLSFARGRGTEKTCKQFRIETSSTTGKENPKTFGRLGLRLLLLKSNFSSIFYCCALHCLFLEHLMI